MKRSAPEYVELLIWMVLDVSTLGFVTLVGSDFISNRQMIPKFLEPA